MTTSPPAFDALIAATDAASGVLDGHRRSRSDNIQTALIQANSSGHHHPTNDGRSTTSSDRASGEVKSSLFTGDKSTVARGDGLTRDSSKGYDSIMSILFIFIFLAHAQVC